MDKGKTNVTCGFLVSKYFFVILFYLSLFQTHFMSIYRLCPSTAVAESAVNLVERKDFPLLTKISLGSLFYIFHSFTTVELSYLSHFLLLLRKSCSFYPGKIHISHFTKWIFVPSTNMLCCTLPSYNFLKSCTYKQERI